jgi:hypothetical protein
MAKKNINSAAIKRALKIGALSAGLGAVGLGGGLFAHDQIRGGGVATDAAMNDISNLFKSKEEAAAVKVPKPSEKK